ncbi:protein AKNAD1 [Sorex fumeus]|uniref:protein AKNAD1 n=1 Tax=Sorex fumeus TaxID=62283 RepID=UPI0024ACA416|nr:protein AKNAD1 [Sorex fumeus]
MDEADFSEDRTSQQLEDLPYDGDFTQIKTYNHSSNNDIYDVPSHMISTAENHQEKNPPKETYRNVDLALVPNKMTNNAINDVSIQEKLGTLHPHPPASKRNPPKTNISSTLLHHISKEELLNGQGITYETLLETSDTDSDSCDEANIKSLFLRYSKKYQLEEQPPELTNQSPRKREGENSNETPSKTEENPTDFRRAVGTGDRGHQGNPNFLTKIKSQNDKQKSGHGQALQKQKTENASSGCWVKYGQDQAHDLCSNFLNVAPKEKNPQNSHIDRLLIVDKQTRFIPTLRDKLAIVQDILESMARLNCTEKHEQRRKTMVRSCLPQMNSTIHFHQEHLPGMESDTSPVRLSSTGHKNVSSSSSYIFQKISQGSQMCQELKEQTNQLKTKVEAFSKSIAQDPSHHLKARKQALETLQESHLPEQEFPVSEKEQVTSQPLVYKHESPAVSDDDPERKMEGEAFKLEMLLETAREKANRRKYSSAPFPPLCYPFISNDLASTFSPPLNEENPNTSATWNAAERNKPRCYFCHRALDWQHKMEKKDHRKIPCDRLPDAIPEKALHPDAILSSDMGHNCCFLSGTDLQNNECEDCASKLHRPPGACPQEASKAFHYKYNIPGENYFNHTEKSVPLCFLNENTNSSSTCSKSESICSWTANSKSYEDEYVLIPGKKYPAAFLNYSSDPATPSPHFHSCRFSGNKCLHNVSSIKETEPEVLNTSLGHAIRTATILKETTDKMIRTIAEDLAKVQRWRNQLKY